MLPGETGEERSDGSLDFRHFLSAAQRLTLEERRTSDIHGQGGVERVGLGTRGQRESSAEERDDSRVADATSVERLEKDSRGGREAVTQGVKEEGEREERLRRTEVVRVGGGGGGRSRGREKEMKW